MKKNLIFISSIFVLVSCSKEQNKGTKTDSAIVDSIATAAAPDLSKNPDMTYFVAEVDADKDGKMTKIEWSGKGLPNSSYDMFEKGRGFVTIEDYQKNPAPDGIDGNKDGKLTVAEFVTFDKIMSAKMKEGNMPPPPK